MLLGSSNALPFGRDRAISSFLRQSFVVLSLHPPATRHDGPCDSSACEARCCLRNPILVRRDLELAKGGSVVKPLSRLMLGTCLALGHIWPAAAQQVTPMLADALQRGGYVLLLRHMTAERVNEPSPMDLTKCTSQHRLTDKGRDEARNLGQALQALKVPIGDVLSSGYCRTMETARLAFGRAEASEALLHPAYVPLPGLKAPPNFAQRTESLKKLIATPPAPGTNMVLVTHGENIKEALGFPVSPGETVVFHADGKAGMAFVARVLANGWSVGQSDIRTGMWGGAKANEGPEISTAELMQVLKSGAAVLDVRSVKECAIAHIPGSVCMPGVVRSDGTYGDHIEQIVRTYPDRATPIVLYCNGPYCGKSKRTAQQLAEKGYTSVRRYQLGLPVWRALGNTVQTDLAGLAYILKDDRTAVFVDARVPDKYKVETIPRSVNVRAGEAKVANEDGRLPHTDKGTRIVIFGDSIDEARTVAAEIAQNAYWNSSYFGGSYDDIRRAKLW
jgi:rhodanese-related sulfurtransferase